MTPSTNTPLRELMKGIIPEEKIPEESVLRLVRAVYCAGCDDNEFSRYMYFCTKYCLDPLEGYIQCVKYKSSSPALIFLGKKAMLTIASRNKNFNGIQTGIFYRNPNLIVSRNLAGEPNQAPTYSTLKLESNKKPDMYAYCIIYRKDRPIPIYVEIKASEYHRGTDIWNSKYETMAKKVAMAQCLEIAFPEEFASVSMPEEFGLTTDEEGNITEPESDLTTSIPETIAAAIAAAPVLPEGMHIQPKVFVDETGNKKEDSEITNEITSEKLNSVSNIINSHKTISKEDIPKVSTKFQF